MPQQARDLFAIAQHLRENGEPTMAETLDRIARELEGSAPKNTLAWYADEHGRLLSIIDKIRKALPQ